MINLLSKWIVAALVLTFSIPAYTKSRYTVVTEIVKEESTKTEKIEIVRIEKLDPSKVPE